MPAAAHLLILLAGAAASLLLGIFLPRERQTWNALTAGLALAACAAAVAAMLLAPPGVGAADSHVADAPALIASLLALLATGLVLLLSLNPLRGNAREAEFYTLLLLVCLGALATVGAADLLQLLLGVLLMSAASAPLVAYRRGDRLAVEAAVKLHLSGALTQFGLLYGLILLYGLSGSTLLADLARHIDPDNHAALSLAGVLVVTGLGAKAGTPPAPYWVPDTAQAAPPPVGALLLVLPKLAALLALARVSGALQPAMDWGPLLAAAAALAMTWGSLAATRQDDLRRLLGYLAIAHGGFLLMALVAAGQAIALPGLLYAALAYLLAMIGACAALAALGRDTIADLRGLAYAQPLAATALAAALLSLLGLPPLAGFVAKFVLFTGAFQAGYGWLTGVALVATAVSLHPTLRVLAPMVQLGPAGGAGRDRVALVVAVVCALSSLALGLLAAPFFPTAA